MAVAREAVTERDRAFVPYGCLDAMPAPRRHRRGLAFIFILKVDSWENENVTRCWLNRNERASKAYGFVNQLEERDPGGRMNGPKRNPTPSYISEGIIFGLLVLAAITCMWLYNCSVGDARCH
jgi:hypothetical protein